MSKGTIKYSQEFKSEFGNRWIGIDLVVNENDDWDEKFREAEQKVKLWGHGEIRPMGGWPLKQALESLSQPIPSLDYKAKERVEILIENSADEKELANYKESAAEYGLTTQYMSRLKSFQK